MKTLETEIKYQGRTLTQIKQNGMVALYELRNAAGLLYGYELIRIQIRPEETIIGKQYPEREGYPSPEQWGTDGFSFGRNYEKEALETFHTWVGKLSGASPLAHLGHPEGQDTGEGA